MRRIESVILIIILSIFLAVGLTCYMQVIRPMALFIEEKRAIAGLLTQWWEGRPPPRIDAHHWEGAWVVAYNGFGNVCFSPDHVSLQEMQRLKADIQAKMR